VCYELGGITNNHFNERWTLGGFIAYAFRDERKFKYNAFGRLYRVSVSHGQQVGISYLRGYRVKLVTSTKASH